MTDQDQQTFASLGWGTELAGVGLTVPKNLMARVAALFLRLGCESGGQDGDPSQLRILAWPGNASIVLQAVPEGTPLPRVTPESAPRLLIATTRPNQLLAEIGEWAKTHEIETIMASEGCRVFMPEIGCTLELTVSL